MHTYSILLYGIIIFAVLAIAYITYNILIKKPATSFPIIGDAAPNFTLINSEGERISLSSFAGKNVVLYFYPKSDTPGCTKEACSIRDSFVDFRDNDIVVLGVSYDTPEAQKAFKEKYHLPFILLSDSNKEVAKMYGAYTGPLNELFPNRMTFIIDKQQKISKILYKVDIATHTQDVLTAIKEHSN